VTLHPGLDRIDQELDRHEAQVRLQVGGEYLAIARRAEQAAEPLELCGQPFGLRTRDDLAERPEGGTQPAGGHPHLVHRVELVGAHHRLERLQRARLHPQVGQHHVARRRRAPWLGSGDGEALAIVPGPFGSLIPTALRRPALLCPTLIRAGLIRAGPLRAGPLRAGLIRAGPRLAAGFGVGRVHCHHGPLPRPER